MKLQEKFTYLHRALLASVIYLLHLYYGYQLLSLVPAESKRVFLSLVLTNSLCFILCLVKLWPSFLLRGVCVILFYFSLFICGFVYAFEFGQIRADYLMMGVAAISMVIQPVFEGIKEKLNQ